MPKGKVPPPWKPLCQQPGSSRGRKGGSEGRAAGRPEPSTEVLTPPRGPHPQMRSCRGLAGSGRWNWGRTTWGLECDLGHNWACVQDRAQVCHRHSTVDKSKGRVGGLPWHPHSPVFTVGTALPPWLWESISSRRCPHITRGQDLSRCPGVVPLQKQG